MNFCFKRPLIDNYKVNKLTSKQQNSYIFTKMTLGTLLCFIEQFVKVQKIKKSTDAVKSYFLFSSICQK